MRITVKTVALLSMIAVFTGCDQFTYSAHSKKAKQKARPSVILLNSIVSFREEFNSWPFSKEEFLAKGPQYRASFNGFPYMQATFHVIDNNTMTFYFSDYIKDIQNYNQSQKIDLNSYSGEVRFYKEKDKFIWKIKMN